MGVVVDHRLAEARRLAHADVAGDDGLEHQLGEVLADLGLDVLGQTGPAVVHRQQHPRNRQPRVELTLHQRQGVQQAGEPFQGEVLGLDGDDHPVGSHERVDGQRPERGRAVQQDERVAVPDREQRLAQPRLGPGHARQFDGRAGQVWSCRNDAQMRDGAGHHRLGQRDLAQERVVDGWRGVLVDAEPEGGVGLGVHVHQQRLVAGLGDASGQVDGSRGLAHPALLVGDRVDGPHRP